MVKAELLSSADNQIFTKPPWKGSITYEEAMKRGFPEEMRVHLPDPTSDSLASRVFFRVSGLWTDWYHQFYEFDLFGSDHALEIDDWNLEDFPDETEALRRNIYENQTTTGYEISKHFETYLYRMVGAVRYEKSGETTEALTFLSGMATQGKRIAFIDAHAGNRRRNKKIDWFLATPTLKDKVKADDILSAVSKSIDGGGNPYGCIYISGCNRFAVEPDMTRIGIPVVAHTNVNDMITAPARVYTPGSSPLQV